MARTSAGGTGAGGLCCSTKVYVVYIKSWIETGAGTVRNNVVHAGGSLLRDHSRLAPVPGPKHAGAEHHSDLLRCHYRSRSQQLRRQFPDVGAGTGTGRSSSSSGNCLPIPRPLSGREVYSTQHPRPPTSISPGNHSLVKYWSGNEDVVYNDPRVTSSSFPMSSEFTRVPPFQAGELVERDQSSARGQRRQRQYVQARFRWRREQCDVGGADSDKLHHVLAGGPLVARGRGKCLSELYFDVRVGVLLE